MDNGVYGGMIHVNLSGKGGEPDMSESGSAAQLRREAGKARKLAEAAFGEEERQRLSEVAALLDHEAAAIEATLTNKHRKGSR
jgi:hypothetical protein